MSAVWLPTKIGQALLRRCDERHPAALEVREMVGVGESAMVNAETRSNFQGEQVKREGWAMGEGTGKGDGVIGALEVAVMGALGHRRSSKIKAAMEQLGEEREILGIGDGDEEGCTMHTKVQGDNLMHTKMQENTL